MMSYNDEIYWINGKQKLKTDQAHLKNRLNPLWSNKEYDKPMEFKND